MIVNINKEWFGKSAEIEGDSEVGAGIAPGKEIFQLECGTWVWMPNPGSGAYYSSNLRKIVDELERLNNEN